jgi:anti-sigma regulatory factor (Ser/Thr protein kinase)
METALLTLPATADNARTVRLVVGAAARRAGVAEDHLDDVRLAIGEVIGLAVHRDAESDGSASSRGVERPLTVRMREGDDEFSVIVEDTIAARLGQIPAAAELALPLIEALCSRMEVQDNPAGGQSVTVAWQVTD